MNSDQDVYTADDGDRPVERSPRGRYIRFAIRLGTGAYKSVYKAYDTDQGIDVAWNAIDIGVLPASEKTRIIQEVQLLQKLEHKNIINFYGSWFSKEKNQVVFITEIMTSGTLKSYIKRVQFVKWKIIKRWCGQILEGLMYLHTQKPPVIHRDLKCDNIFINGNTGDLRIGDLGLSTQLAVQKSRAQSVLGTPEFMAPELYDESYDEKVDIYAFGMCVLEMVTKEVPYSECVNPAQIYKKVTAGIRPRGLQRIVSQAARDFIELCLSRGNGEIDVSAAYLLNHPFLKPSEDDSDMIQVLSDDELQQQEMAAIQPKPVLPEISPRTLDAELNMESAPKLTVARRDSAIESASSNGASSTSSMSSPVIKKSVAAEPEALAISSTQASEQLKVSPTPVTIPSEGKTSGQHYLVATKVGIQMDDAARVGAATSSAPPVTPTVPPIPEDATEPIVEGPVSDQKDVDNHVEAFLSNMSGNEASIQNSRIALMGGRGHRIEADDNEEPVEGAAEMKPERALTPPSSIVSTPLPTATIESPMSTMPTAAPLVEVPSTVSPPVSRPASAPRIRSKRYEIRSSNDPENSHSILLNLRIAIDGKSKEIKFPFNFFTESPHEVACELAVDVGILEPDLEDITDSISFLVTESKINNLPDLDQDVWDEAPEPHSFSSKPLPHVSKMAFVGQQVVSMTVNETPLPPQPPALATALPLMRGASVPPVASKELTMSREATGLRETSSGIISASPILERAVSAQPLRMPRAQSELFQPEEYTSALTEQERGVSLGTSASDPNFLRAVREFEDRIKLAKSSYDEQETRMEEKYQSEIERLRNMMSQLEEKTQRATMARRERLLNDEFSSEAVGIAFSDDNILARSSAGLSQQLLLATIPSNGVMEAATAAGASVQSTLPPPSLAVRRFTSADPRLEAPLSLPQAVVAPVTPFVTPTATANSPTPTVNTPSSAAVAASTDMLQPPQ